MQSLAVPGQPDLLPLASMPEEATGLDEQRTPDAVVQELLSASLEPTADTRVDGVSPTTLVESKPIADVPSGASPVSPTKDHDEFFDVESETETTQTTSIVKSDESPITLAEAEKLQRHAASEHGADEFHVPELDLTSATSLATTGQPPSDAIVQDKVKPVGKEGAESALPSAQQQTSLPTTETVQDITTTTTRIVPVQQVTDQGPFPSPVEKQSDVPGS